MTQVKTHVDHFIASIKSVFDSASSKTMQLLIFVL